MPRLTATWWLLSRLALIAVGCWLLASAAIKAQDVAAFRAILQSHELITGSVALPAALVVTAAEAAIGILCLWAVAAVPATSTQSNHSNLASPRVAWGTVGLLLCVLGIYALVVSRSPPTSPTRCGCGLSQRLITDWRALGHRNLLLAGGACFAGLLSVRPSSSRHAERQAPHPAARSGPAQGNQPDFGTP